MIRVFRHYLPRSLVILGVGEALILFGAVYAAVSVALLEIDPTAMSDARAPVAETGIHRA